MLTKSFTLASAVSLAGAVIWVTSTAACGGSEETPAKATTSSSSGSAGDGGDTVDSGGTSSSGGTTSSGGPSSSGLVDPGTVDGVTIEFKACEPFTKCDGPLDGNYKVIGGCLADDTFAQYKKICSDLKEHDVVIKASGTIEATKTGENAGTIVNKTSVFLSAQLDVPKACAQAFPGGGDDPCNTIPLILTSGFAGSAFDHVVCQDAGELCKCAGDVKIEEDPAPDQYTTDGTGALTTQTPTRNFEYCPKGDVITYRETTKSNKTFGMFVQVKKQ